MGKKVETKGEARSQTHNKILIRWFSVDVTTKAQIMLKRVKIAQNAKSKFWPENQLKKHKNMVQKKVAKLLLNMLHLSLKTKTKIKLNYSGPAASALDIITPSRSKRLWWSNYNLIPNLFLSMIDKPEKNLIDVKINK